MSAVFIEKLFAAAVRRSRPLQLAVIIILLWLTPNSAVGSAMDLYGFGSRGTAMGGAMTAAAEDFTATYYNLAALTMSRNQIATGFLLSFDTVAIRLMARPGGYDVPDVGGMPTIPYSYRLKPRQDTEGVTSTNGIFVGATSNLGIDEVRIGFAIYIPIGGLGARRTYYSDEREQWFSNQLHYELISERVQHEVFMFGMAVRPLDWISLGIGVSVGLGSRIDSVIYMDNPIDQENIDINLDVQSGTSYSLNAGLLFLPLDWLRVGVSMRGEQSIHLTGTNEIQVHGLHDNETYPSHQQLDFTVGYNPLEIAVGLAFLTDIITAAVDVTYERWSEYLDQHSARGEFEDMFVPRFGVEAYLGDFILRGGFAYEMSPVPDQSGRTNYVDNDRFVLSLGAGVHATIFDMKLDVSVHVQFHLLDEHTQHKEQLASYESCDSGTRSLCDEVPDDTVNPQTGTTIPQAQGLQTGNPGFPGYTSGGTLFSAGIDIVWEF